MGNFTIANDVKGSVSFFLQNGTVQRFHTTPARGAVTSGCQYVCGAISDGNLHENYDSTYSAPQISSPALFGGGTGIPNSLPQLRPRVVTYKLYFKTIKPQVTANNEYGRIGMGVKQYVQAFIREFLDVGDLKVQYGTWGGIDIGGYLVDAPQATYSKDGSQCALSFVLQFTNPITLHPNFTNSVLWNDVSGGSAINLATLTSADNGRILAANVSRNETTGTLSASFSQNIKRWSNIAFLNGTAANNVQGTLKIYTGRYIGHRETELDCSANTATLFTSGTQYYYNYTNSNIASNLHVWNTSRNSIVGTCAVQPTMRQSASCSITFTPKNAESTSGLSGCRFVLFGW